MFKLILVFVILLIASAVNAGAVSDFHSFGYETEQAGHYAVELTYYAVPAPEGELFKDTEEIKLSLNGAYLGEYSLYRYRKSGELYTDEAGNHLPPVSGEYDGLITAFIKRGSDVVHFYFEAGRGELVFAGAGIIIESVTLCPYAELPSYENIRPAGEQITLTPRLETRNSIGSYTIFIQAEKPSYKTDAALRVTSDYISCSVIPSSPSKKLYNTLGGADSWSTAGQAASWEFHIANDGFYRFSVKARNTSRAASYRRVLINNSVPCKELDAYEFVPGKNWYRQDFTDANGDYIYIFLKAGKHVLTLEAVEGGYAEYAGGGSLLELDYIEIGTVHEDFHESVNTVYDRLIFAFSRFIHSYFKSYTTVTEKNNNGDDVIHVWVDADYETAVIVRELYDYAYRQGGIGGKRAVLSLVMGSVQEAAAAGNPPDAALFTRSGNMSYVLLLSDQAQSFADWFSLDETQFMIARNIKAVTGR